MSRTGLVVLSAALGLAGCRGQSAGPDGRDFPHVTEAIDRHAPTAEELASIRYQGLAAGAVTLQDGAWRGAPAAGAEAPTVALLHDPQLAGDITGNGTNEAVVLLQERRPGLPPSSTSPSSPRSRAARPTSRRRRWAATCWSPAAAPTSDSSSSTSCVPHRLRPRA